MATTLNVNGKAVVVQSPPDTPLLWVLRDDAGPHRHEVRLRRRPVRRLHRARRRPADPLLLDAGRRAGRQEVTTIEGLRRRAIRCRWPGSRRDVPQCGYCQSGQIMSAAALLRRNAAAHRRRHRRRHGRQHLPLRHLPAHPRGDQGTPAAAPELSPRRAVRPLREPMNKPLERHRRRARREVLAIGATRRRRAAGRLLALRTTCWASAPRPTSAPSARSSASRRTAR